MRVEIRDIGIPPRPTILAQIENEMALDSPDFIRLARIISSDVAISAALIKTANSPFFSFGKPVRTIDEALMVLGLKLVASTVAGLSLQKAFGHIPNMERFWTASGACAQLTRWLARRVRLPARIRPEDAYTYALFRDCGIPVLSIPFPEYRQALLEASQAEHEPFTASEERAVALNHALVGAELAESWLLPESVCNAIRYHHDVQTLASNVAPLTDESRKLIALAQLAEHLVQENTGLMKNAEWAKLGPSCLAILGVDNDELGELHAEYRAALKPGA